MDEIGGVGTQITTLGFCKNQVLHTDAKEVRVLYGGSPGANSTFSVFETGVQKCSQRGVYKGGLDQKHHFEPKGGFWTPTPQTADSDPAPPS